MELTFLNDLGQSFVVEIDSNMELENVMALLEAEVSGEGLSLKDPAEENLLLFSLVSPWANKVSRMKGGT
jgi:hypothetical protein